RAHDGQPAAAPPAAPSSAAPESAAPSALPPAALAPPALPPSALPVPRLPRGPPLPAAPGMAAEPTRSIQRAGLGISALIGSVSGHVHTRLNTAIPACSTTADTKCAPCWYCFIFRSMPRMRRTACSPRLPEPRLAVNLVLISATDGTTLGPTASIT